MNGSPRWKYRFVCLWGVFFCLSRMAAQQASYTRWLPSDGLPSTTVYYVMQDRAGYIWFATDKGVARFDGYRFQTFTTTDGLGDNDVFDIFEDSQGRIWFSSYNGEISWYQQGTFFSRKNNNLPFSLTFNSVGLKALEDHTGAVYILGQHQVFKFTGQQATPVSTPSGMDHSTLVRNPAGEVICLSHTHSQVIFNNLTTGAAHPCSLDPASGRMPLLNTKATMAGQDIYYCTNRFVMHYSQATGKLRALATLDRQILSVADAGNGLLLVGTNAGLYRLRAADGTLERTLLHGACFTSMTTDHEGNLWATTLDNGVYLLINPEVDLMNRHTALGFDNCLYINNLSADRLAIGSDGFQCAFVEGQLVRSLQLPVHLGLGKVRGMRQRDNGDLYAMTGITTVRLSPQLAVKQVLLIGLRDLWFAGEQVYITKPNGLAELPLEDFHTSREIEKLAGEKQVAEDGGICFRTGTDGTLYQVGNAGVHFRTAQGWKRLLLPESMQRNISDLCQLPSGDLWIASRVSGLCCLRNGRCFSLGTGEGLPSDFVTCLMSDPSGALWAGTANGLACIRTQMKQGAPAWDIRTFSTGNGLVSNAINDLAFFQGRVWAATEKGVCIFREDQLSRPPVPPRLVLPTVSFHDRRAVARDGIYETPYPRNNLMLTYTAIAPGSAGAITYQYRLAGQDEGWSTTTSTQLQYPSLAPGEYTFEIRALNRNKVPSALQTVRLRILPAFWQTWWFRLSGLLLLLALAGGLVYLRVRALRQTHRLREYLMQLENDKLTSAFDEVTLQRKMLELEQKALLLHMNPHFVFNSINAIHGFYASGEPDLGRKYISRFSQLLRTILDFSSQKRISLRQETDMLDLYLSLNQLRFDDKFAYALETDPALDQEAIHIPPMLIQPFVENALLHGIAPLKRKGQIWIRLWREQACLVCEVEDNGIGRVRARALQEGRIHTSTGIKVTEERIRLHNGLPPGPVVEITDLYGPEQQPCGTLVRFRILLEEEYTDNTTFSLLNS